MAAETTEQRICGRCGKEPALKGQRWGRNCKAAYARARTKGWVLVPREFVRRGTLDAKGRVRVAALRKARKRLNKTSHNGHKGTQRPQKTFVNRSDLCERSSAEATKP